MTRTDLAKWLKDLIESRPLPLDPAKHSDRLKAAELLSKMLGWNEPEKQEHLHQHEIILDSSMLTRLQSAYSLTLKSLDDKQAKVIEDE
jgi:hypothetical protein